MSVMKIFSNVEMASNANLSLDTTGSLPVSPRLGTQHMLDGVLHYYTSIDGAEPVWVPVGTKRLNATVQFPDTALEWLVPHNLGTFDIIAAVYDMNGTKMDAPFTIISADLIKFSFTNPVNGKAVVFGASQKYAGFTPAVSQVTGETVSVGTGEPDASTTSTLYVQVTP